MDGQRLAIKQVCGATYRLQLVDEGPCGLLRFEVDGKDSTRQRTELHLRESVERVILETCIVHAFNLWQLLTLLGEPQGGLSLPAEADVERIEAEGLHVGHLGRHQSTKIGHEFCLDTSRESLFLTNALRACL